MASRTNTYHQQLDDASALVHESVAGASLSANSDAASATGGDQPCSDTFISVRFFARGKVTQSVDTAKVYWKY